MAAPGEQSIPSRCRDALSEPLFLVTTSLTLSTGANNLTPIFLNPNRREIIDPHGTLAWLLKVACLPGTAG